MLSCRSGSKWVHVSCALWIPEVSFGDPDRVEPITNISRIPVSPLCVLGGGGGGSLVTQTGWSPSPTSPASRSVLCVCWVGGGGAGGEVDGGHW